MRGAWIEIDVRWAGCSANMSLPVRGAWIEIAFEVKHAQHADKSLPVRGAWIEICHTRLARHHRLVAPRAGSVD